MPRKSTDVLLSIEEKINLLLNHSSNQSMLLSNLANRISKLESLSGDQVVLNADKSEKNNINQSTADIKVSSVNKSLPGLKPGITLVGQSKNVSKQSNGIPDYVGSINSSTTVQQKVVYSDKKPITRASVEILDFNGEVKYKSTTNNSGKWVDKIAVGTYMIKVHKKATSKKPEVNIESKIVVYESDKPITLNVLEM